jgi:RNA polymerase sigma factor (sigma-70 family)
MDSVPDRKVKSPRRQRDNAIPPPSGQGFAEPHRPPVTPDDVAAWEREYGPRIKQVFRRKMREDAAQERYQAFWLKVTEKRHTIRETHPSAILSWLLTTAKRMIPDHLRRKARDWATDQAAYERYTPERDPTVSEAIRNEEGDRFDRLRKAMRSLPAKYRQAVENVIMEGKTFTEWAEEAGIERRTASARLTEALRRLREMMGGSPDEPAA